MWRAIIFTFTLAMAAGCSAPVASRAEPSGEAIAFGAGSGGPDDACFTCHGLKGEGDSPVPRLAGLSTGYLVKQLEDYAGRWRDEASMSPIAARLSDSERVAVASYYSALNEPASRRPRPALTGWRLFIDGDVERGLKPCASCHGPGGRNGGLAPPRLAGQDAGYVRNQLTAWKESRRRNDPRDTMGAIARKLSVAEIDSLAIYVEALP